MNKQKIVGMMIGVIVLAGGIGYMVGRGGGVPSLGGLSTSDQAKLEAAKKMFPPMPDSNFVFGQVKSVSGKVITLSTPTNNPFDESPTERQVTVTSATKIVKNEFKSPETMQKEQEAYTKKMSSWKPGSTTEAPPTPPMPFVEKQVSISDIKVGDQINVEAANKIRFVEKFDATKISIQFSAAPAPAPAPVPVPVPAR